MSESALYIVATPIGNMGDMTPRAIEVLNSVDLIAAEDTRHSLRLLQNFGIRTPMWTVHDHNERTQADRIVQRLLEGENIALISDAGTPLISDPGYVLVRRVREAGVRVISVPGACAMIAALSVSGMPTDRFIFEGFLPAKEQARLNVLKTLADETRTLVFYESPHRILASLQSMCDQFGAERNVTVARELTKTFETVHGDRLGALIEWVRDDPNQQKGEFVVLVQGCSDQKGGLKEEGLDTETHRILELLLEELSLKQAASLAAKITGVKKKRLYQAALEMKGLAAAEVQGDS
jgi:16S rRNA (cytidine1402-2'-O)-methyltransferase